jgi:hypothetical protein
METLHETLNKIFEKTPLDSIAAQLGVAASAVSQWRTGAEVCPKVWLARIVDEFCKNADQPTKRQLLLKLFLLRESALFEKPAKEREKWTEASKNLAVEAIAVARNLLNGKEDAPYPKTTGRTLQDFPNSFYPLAVVSGDKREETGNRINQADFGATSASPAEARWLLRLGLRSDTEFYSDKVFVLESVSELKARFGKQNLLVIGSPGSNHLARRLLLSNPTAGWKRGVPFFRFNLPQFYFQEIENFLSKLRGKNAQQLVGEKGNPDTEAQVKFWLRFLFTGGILDPTYARKWIRSVEIPHGRDFGVVTLARNPFSDPGDASVCIMAAGFHMFGTAHALRMLSNSANFAEHPLGGVVRVNMNMAHPFAKRFDESDATWDDDSEYKIEDVRNGFLELEQMVPPGVHIQKEEIRESLAFLQAL